MRQRISNSCHKNFNFNLNLSSKLVFAIIYALYHTSRCLGIACLSFDLKVCRVIESAGLKLYSGVLLLLVMLFMPFAMHILYTEMTFLRENQLLTYVGYIRYGMLLLCALATLYMQLYYRKSIIQCINELLISWTSSSSSSSLLANKRVVWQIMAKCLTIVLQFLWTIFLILHDKALGRFLYLMTLLYVEYCQLILVTTLNLLFFGCWSLAVITRELNHKLLDIFKQLKWFGRRRHHQLDLSLQLEQVIFRHWKLYKLSFTLLSLYGWQLLCFLTFVIMESVTQIFIMYFVAVDSLTGRYDLRHAAAGTMATIRDCRGPEEECDNVDDNNNGRVIINPFALFYVFGIIWDMFLILLMIDEMRTHFIRTRFIFCHGVFLKSLISTANHAMDQCLSCINLYLLHLQTSISFGVCGLFTIDKHLILRLLETIFLYLLLLIQFDLIIN